MANSISQSILAQIGIDPETGEITTTIEECRASPKARGVSRQNITDQSVKNYRPNGKKFYGKLHDLGAHAMLQMPVCKLTKVVALMLRDSTYKGISYINPILVSKELSIDVEYARKLLNKVEGCEFAVKVDTDTGFYYLINPSYYQAGDEEDEQIARKIWSSARTKRLKRECRSKSK